MGSPQRARITPEICLFAGEFGATRPSQNPIVWIPCIFVLHCGGKWGRVARSWKPAGMAELLPLRHHRSDAGTREREGQHPEAGPSGRDTTKDSGLQVG